MTEPHASTVPDSQSHRPMRVVLALGLLALAAFCAFGFLATYEPMDGGALGWRIGYGAALAACT